MELLERDRDLEMLLSALEQAVEGFGSIVAISGEAGVGKTELVHSFINSCRERVPVLWGGCDDLSTPRALGPVRDIAIQVGGRLKELLASSGSRGDVLDAIFELLDRGRPATVAVIEDVHWADEATLDVLKFLGRRIDRTRAVLIVTYRAEEVGPNHPLRLVVGDLPSGAVRRLRLQPLSKPAVEKLARRYSGSTTELYEATGGNPFLVSEALLVPDLSASAAVRDAVRVRASRLSSDALRLAEAVAVVPTQAERKLLESIGDASPDLLDECRQRGLLEYDDDWVWYRHELVRTAMCDSLTLAQKRDLNGEILRELVAQPADVARIVHHAQEAAENGYIARYAPAAARQASAASSHREAIAHYRLAAAHSTGAADDERAALLSDYSVECYLANEVSEALDISEDALELWANLGVAERQGDLLRWQSRFHWWLGQAAAAEEAGKAAVELLETVPDASGLAMAYSNMAQLAMLAQDFRPALDWSQKAIDLARSRDDYATLSHALNNLGSARMRIGELEGQAMLEESLAIAVEQDLDDHAGRAYANLIWTALDYRNYDLADQYLSDGIPYAVRRDLGGSLNYMTSERARLRFQRGDWAGAEDDVRWVLSQREEPGITHMPSLAVQAHLAVRRGDASGPQAIEDAWTLAQPTAELQRMAPIAAARAELAWLRKDTASVRAAAEPAYTLAVSLNQPWITDELAFWMWRSGEEEVSLGPTQTPFGLQVAGQWIEAAKTWQDIGCPYEYATALLDSDDPEHLLAALDTLLKLGATPAAHLVQRKLRRRGVRNIPRGPRRTTRSNPAGLTPRQMEVLGLLAKGRTNSEIADVLFVSPKTVDHHVSAILAKLDVSSRSEAARIAVEGNILE